MLKRKATASKNAPRTKRSGSPNVPKLKTPPVRRRFVISSKAVKLDEVKPAPATPSPAKAPAAKQPANGQPSAPAPAGLPTSVDLTETIKTLLHLSQEHGYVTYDDINDILPDNLSPEDLDARAVQAAQPGRGNRHGPGRGRARRTQAAGTGAGGRGRRGCAAGNSGRPGAHVYEPDGQGAPAHARTGSRDLQKNRGCGSGDEAHRLQPRLHGEGTHRHRGKIIVRAAEGAF